MKILPSQSSDFAPIYTKLNPPHNTVEPMLRTRLCSVEHLISGEYQVVTAVAPAGYGKSTLLTQWQQTLCELDIKNGWLSLDDNDNSQARLVEYFIAALQCISPEIGLKAMHLLQSGVVSEFEAVFDSLLVDIWDTEEESVLFIDDIHLLVNKDILESLSNFLQQLPPTICIVISGRKYPKMGLSKLKLQHRLLDYGVDEIRFKPEEVHQFICQYKHLDLDDDSINLLQLRTEGWVVALQLISLAFGEVKEKAEFIHCLSGRNKDITDYLSDVILSQQSEEMREFLLHTSVLDRMCSPLCHAVTGKLHSQQLLESIEAQNLFLIPLDRERKWYRYHHLFSDYLRYQLQKRQPDRVSDLYRRASVWCSQNELQNEAIHYALAGKNFDQAGQLLAVYAIELLKVRGDHEVMLQWINVLPEEYLIKYPIIRISYASSLLFSNLHDKYNEQLIWFDAFFTRYASEVNDSQIQFIRSYVDMLHVVNFAFNGKLQLSCERFENWMEKYANRSDQFISAIGASCMGYICSVKHEFNQGIELSVKGVAAFKSMNLHYSFCFPSAIYLCLLVAKGELSEAKIKYETFFSFVRQGLSPYHFSSLMLDFHYAEVLYEQGEVKKVVDILQPNLFVLARNGNIANGLSTYRSLIRIYLYHNQIDEAMSLLQRTELLVLPRGWSYLVYVLAGEMLRYYFNQNMREHAEKVIQRYQLFSPQAMNKIADPILELKFKRLLSVLKIRLEQANGHYHEALTQLSLLINEVRCLNTKHELIPLLLVQAKLFYQQEKMSQAEQVFLEALMLGQSDHYIQLFLEEGHVIKMLLERVTSSLKHEDETVLTNYINTLIKAFKYQEKIKNSQTQMLDPADTRVKFTKRELSILKLLSSDSSHQKIADQLSIGLNTLKWNLRNIYRKLNVRNRTGAIMLAKKEGIF